ncbi:MAG: hypothetical protein RLP44_08075 [Aggregatilineales bacterium]
MANSAQATQAQTNSDETCPALVETALEAVDEFCANTGRNQACYGNFNLEAQARATAEDFRFEDIGDIANVSDITSLRLNGMNEENGEWGVVLLRLQTSLPDTLPGQNVTFILFGEVEVTNAVDEEQIESGEMTPMQAFYLTTGIGDAQCSEAPDSGLIVQTPEGVGEVAFTVNEVDVQMGSTVLFQANPDGEDGEMTVTTIEGAAALNLDGEAFPIIEGTMARMPLQRIGGRLRPPRLPERIETYNDRRLQGLPLNQLQRRVQPPPPLNGRELIQVRQRFRNGMAMCGEAPFPSCDHIPGVIGGLPCIIPSMVDRLTPEQQAGRSICNVEETPLDQLPQRNGANRQPPPNRSGENLPPPPNSSGTGQLPPPPNGSGSNVGGNIVPQITPTPIRVVLPTPTRDSIMATRTPLPTLPTDGNGGSGNLPPPPNGGGNLPPPPPPPGG